MFVIQSCNRERLEFLSGNFDAVAEFCNVEEGPMGEDIIEYVCPDCGEVHKSAVYI